MLEEIRQETENERLLGITENIFTYNGIDEHEIVFIYQAEFKDKNAYTGKLKGGINAAKEEIKLCWASLEEIKSKGIKLYPPTLLELLENQ